MLTSTRNATHLAVFLTVAIFSRVLVGESHLVALTSALSASIYKVPRCQTIPSTQADCCKMEAKSVDIPNSEDWIIGENYEGGPSSYGVPCHVNDYEGENSCYHYKVDGPAMCQIIIYGIVMNNTGRDIYVTGKTSGNRSTPPPLQPNLPETKIPPGGSFAFQQTTDKWCTAVNPTQAKVYYQKQGAWWGHDIVDVVFICCPDCDESKYRKP